VLVAATVTVVLVATSGGSDRPGSSPSANAPRPVTADEANRLAVMRFQNYRTGLHFRTTTNAGLTLTGYLDFHQHLGYAVASENGRPSVVQWSSSTLVEWAAAAGVPTTDPPAQLPATQHRSRALNPGTSDLDALLAILLALGQDRPDNAALVRQDGAMFVRTDTAGGVPVAVLLGPRVSGSGSSAAGALTYWVDDAGQLLRVDIRLGHSTGQNTKAVRVDTDPARFHAFQESTFVGS
jgi:hypothetical protein